MFLKGGQNKDFNSMILIISLASLSVLCIAFLSFVFAGKPILSAVGLRLDVRTLLIIGILGGVIGVAVFAATVFLRAANRAQKAEALSTREVAQLQKRLSSIESIIQAEPQLLVFWEQTGEPNVIINNLEQDLGTPDDPRQVLRFRSWLEPDSASELENSLKNMFQEGSAFNLMLKTLVGGDLEADGRAAGGRLILKFRDVAGKRQELAELYEQQRNLEADIAANRALWDAAPMPVWFRKEDGKLDWVNKAYVKAVEAENYKVVCEKQIELLESRQRKVITKSLAKGKTYSKRHNTIVSGERRAFDTIALPLGKASAGIAIDVADLETVKTELDQLTEAHTRTLDKVATAVAIFGPDQKLNFFNQAYVDLWGLDAQWLETGVKDGEILDKMRTSRMLPEEADYRAWKETQLESYSADEPREDWWYLPDGRSIYVVCEQRPDGGVTYLYDDATERIALESRYNALFDVQKETLENLREGVAVFSTDGRLKLFNNSYANIWKLSHKRLEQGPHIDEIIDLCSVLHDDESSWKEVGRAVTAIHEQRQPINGQFKRMDGSIIEYASDPLPDGATLLTYVDVTDTKRVENMLMERNETLEAADKLKNDFVQNVSYELRTPLTNIIGFSDLLANPNIGPLSQRQKEYLGDIRASSKTLLSIINDILDLATIDAGAMELQLEPVKVAGLIKAAALGVRERLVRAKLGLDIRVEPGIDEFICDERRVTQILYNLLSNAIGFSPSGSRIRLLCMRDGDNIAFTVLDQGSGIPAEHHETVFKRFESNTEGSRHRGTGLGLSIVKSLVELHGGDIHLRSKEGKGTIIIVRFPEHGNNSGSEPDGEKKEVEKTKPKLLSRRRKPRHNQVVTA